ncbi:MAG: PP2C family protein-serine/threonine phosphatase [Bacteroidales bacterium]
MIINSFSVGSNIYSNEDCLLVKQIDSKRTIAVLADGIGGFSLGKEASEIIVNAITDFIHDNHEHFSAEELLNQALLHADTLNTKRSVETHCKMGAAVAVAYIDGENIHFTWLGNVRIYLASSEGFNQLSTDHTLEVGYGKTLLTRCIKGGGLRDDIPYKSCSIEAEGTLILCTDGLYKHIDVNQLLDISTIEASEDDASMIKVAF